MSALKVALIFLALALIAGLFGFAIVSDTSWMGAKVFFFLFLAVAVITYLRGALYRPVA